MYDHGRIVDKAMYLIRPPKRQFMFTDIHGLTWNDVKDSPEFPAIMPKINQFIAGADYLAAHNAAFDRQVLYKSYGRAGFDIPVQDWICTVKLARRVWPLGSAKLSNVCDYLGIELNHHEALSDSNACAEIVKQAIDAGARLDRAVVGPPSYAIPRQAPCWRYD